MLTAALKARDAKAEGMLPQGEQPKCKVVATVSHIRRLAVFWLNPSKVSEWRDGPAGRARQRMRVYVTRSD